jgi:amino acid adenylation domain-containing protein
MSVATSDIVVFDKKLKEEREYWLGKLSAELPPSGLQPDYTRPADSVSETADLELRFPPELSRKLLKLTGNSSFLLYTSLLATFNVCLSKYVGQPTVVVGSPALKDDAKAARVNNALAIVCEADGQSSFKQLLVRTRETLLEAYARQRYPFQRLIKDLRLTAAENRAALFDIVLLLEGLHEQAPEVKQDMTVAFAREGDTLSARLEYRAGLFKAESVERFGGHFINTLTAALEDMNAPVGCYTMTSSEERRMIIEEWNDTAEEFESDICVHHLFEEQAALTPDRVALVFEGQQLTYAELNARANQLAHYLREQGVGAESRVGVCTERGVEMVVALLGVLKAGGAYVPLDPSYPQERLSFMMKDAGVRALVTQQHLLGALPERGAKVVCLDADRFALARCAEENPPREAGADNLAYVIYTSGSTGKPKGSLITHDNVTRLFAATQSYFNFDSTDVWTLFHSYAFDFSVWELWGALLYGGKVVIIPEEVRRSPAAFYELLAEQKVTVLNQTPSAFRRLSEVDEDPELARELSLRLVIFGGEALDVRSLRRWFEDHGDARPEMVNMYGITETTVHVTYRRLRVEDAAGARGSVIGLPIPDLQVYILNERLEPVPVGVTGEMYVGGAGLGRGYLNRPGLTAERFVPNVYAAEGGSRLYRTGDLGRYLGGGDIEYMGRADQQVKIRGFRIELGEIEVALGKHPQVGDCAVVAREDEPGRKRLVAYVVANGGEPTADELRGFLRERLPDYMVPSAFLTLEALPLTNHGKLDRKALPSPEGLRPELAVQFVMPETEVDRAIASVWQQVLGVERVGIYDNFFDLGGHSMLVAQAHSKLRVLLGRDFSITEMFKYPTVSSLSAYLKREADEGAALGEVRERVEARTGAGARRRQARQQQRSTMTL